MEPSDLFSSLLQDPNAMQKIAGMASQLMQNMPDTAKTQAPSAMPQTAPASPDPTAALLQQAIPAISAIAQSGQQANPARIQLLHAIKPFVSSDACAQIDHAERILSMARMAKAAASQLTASAGQ